MQQLSEVALHHSRVKEAPQKQEEKRKLPCWTVFLGRDWHAQHVWRRWRLLWAHWKGFLALLTGLMPGCQRSECIEVIWESAIVQATLFVHIAQCIVECFPQSIGCPAICTKQFQPDWSIPGGSGSLQREGDQSLCCTGATSASRECGRGPVWPLWRGRHGQLCFRWLRPQESWLRIQHRESQGLWLVLGSHQWRDCRAAAGARAGWVLRCARQLWWALHLQFDFQAQRLCTTCPHWAWPRQLQLWLPAEVP